MYTCCNVRRFLRLLMVDAIIAVVCMAFFFIGRSFFLSTASQEEGIFLPVIMYHSIYDGEAKEYSVTPSQVESDLKWLSDNGYKTVTAQQLVEYTKGEGSLPEKPVMITLDDGYYNNLSQFLPLLEKYDMNAIVSVVGKYTNDYAAADPHSDAYSYLTWEDISELEASGRIEIGNHTYNMHSIKTGRQGCAKLPYEGEKEYMEELRRDVGLLQSEIHENVGIEPIVFAYPFGSLCRESIPVLRDCGFLITLTCRERPNYITRDPECLYGLFRYNRSGFYSTEEYMRILLSE